jgi:hypothetical protein
VQIYIFKPLDNSPVGRGIAGDEILAIRSPHWLVPAGVSFGPEDFRASAGLSRRLPCSSRPPTLSSVSFSNGSTQSSGSAFCGA